MDYTLDMDSSEEDDDDDRDLDLVDLEAMDEAKVEESTRDISSNLVEHIDSDTGTSAPVNDEPPPSTTTPPPSTAPRRQSARLQAMKRQRNK